MNIQLLLERLKMYHQMLKRRWGLIVLAGIIGGALLAIFAATSQKFYVAVASFHPDPGSGGPGLGGLTTDPISLIFGGGPGKSNSTNQMMGVLVSRRISEAVASDSIEIAGQHVLIADKIGEAFPPGFSIERWFKSFFEEPLPPTLEQKVIGAGRKLRSSLEVEVDDYGFIQMQLSFPDYQSLIHISHKYIEHLSRYYETQKTAKAGDNVVFYEKRSDSVRREIDKSAVSAGLYIDKNKYGNTALAQVQGNIKQMELEMLGELYKAQMVALEQAKGQKQQNTPIIQVLDYPDPPYKVVARAPLLFGAIGIFLGIFFAALFIVRKTLTEDIQEIIWSLIEQSAQETDSDELTDP